MESLKSHIIEKLEKAFQPEILQVENESFRHKVPLGSETHFKVLIVSECFASQTPIERQRSIMDLLTEEMKDSIHALSLRAMSISEYKISHSKFHTPPCHKAKSIKK